LINTYILLNEDEYHHLENNSDFIELMKNSNLDLNIIKSQENKSRSNSPTHHHSDKIETFKIEESPKKGGSKRKSFKDMLFAIKEKSVQKIDENEELISLKRNTRIKNRIEKYKMSEDNYENVQENKELLVPNMIFLTASKNQEVLYNEFQKGLLMKNTKRNNITLISLFFVTLIKLVISSEIRNDFFLYGDATFNLLISFLILILLFIIFKEKAFVKNLRKYYSYILMGILIFGIQVIIVENHYAKSELFEKITLLHIMTIILFGSRLKYLKNINFYSIFLIIFFSS